MWKCTGNSNSTYSCKICYYLTCEKPSGLRKLNDLFAHCLGFDPLRNRPSNKDSNVSHLFKKCKENREVAKWAKEEKTANKGWVIDPVPCGQLSLVPWGKSADGAKHRHHSYPTHAGRELERQYAYSPESLVEGCRARARAEWASTAA